MNLNHFFVIFSPEYSLLTNYCNINAYENSNLGIITSGDTSVIMERVVNTSFGETSWLHRASNDVEHF